MQLNLSIKGVPFETAERLRLRAARHHRSLQGELMAIIERAAGEVEFGADAPMQSPSHGEDDRRTSPAVRGWKSIEDLIAERSSRTSRHRQNLPLAADIVRADRNRQ